MEVKQKINQSSKVEINIFGDNKKQHESKRLYILDTQ